MNTIGKKITLAAVAVMGFASFAATAGTGATVVDAPQSVVHFGDLDLDTAAGAKALYGRIVAAAHKVCGDEGSRDLAKAATVKACIDRAVTTSVQNVGNVQLTRIADARAYAVNGRLALAAAR